MGVGVGVWVGVLEGRLALLAEESIGEAGKLGLPWETAEAKIAAAPHLAAVFAETRADKKGCLVRERRNPGPK